MKKPILHLAIISFIILLSFQVNAQNDFRYFASIGIANSALEMKGHGIHLDLSTDYPLTNHLYLDGQISYNYVHLENNWHNAEIKNRGFNLLLGAKLYATKPHRKVRPYVNLLGGPALSKEKSDNFDLGRDFHWGYSVGIFAEFQEKITFGLGLESRDVLFYKLRIKLPSKIKVIIED